MGAVLMFGGQMLVVKVGRMAGQMAAAPLRWGLPSLGRALLSPAPARMLSAEASDALVEIKPGEIDMVSGIPEEHLHRRVVIYSPARTASQQGSGKVGRWKINFVSTQKWENPLMGWTSTGDPYANVGEAGLTFDSAESAKAFAEKHGWEYVSRVPDPQRMIRAYVQLVATLNLLRALPYDF